MKAVPIIHKKTKVSVSVRAYSFPSYLNNNAVYERLLSYSSKKGNHTAYESRTEWFVGVYQYSYSKRVCKKHWLILRTYTQSCKYVLHNRRAMYYSLTYTHKSARSCACCCRDTYIKKSCYNYYDKVRGCRYEKRPDKQQVLY